MSITFPQQLSVLLGLSVLSVVGSGLSAQAQIIDTTVVMHSNGKLVSQELQSLQTTQ